MKNKKLNLEIFQAKRLSKNEQKSILGGDIDPNKGNCCGNSTGGNLP